MKKLLTFCFCILSGILCYAQPYSRPLTDTGKARASQLLHQLLNNQASKGKPPAKETAITQRLISQYQYQYSGGAARLFAVRTFKYSSNTRGSSVNNGYLDFNTYALASGGEYNNLYGYSGIHGFKLQNNDAPQVLCDTDEIVITKGLTDTVLSPAFFFNTTFDADNNVSKRDFINLLSPDIDRTINTYDDNSDISTSLLLRVNNSAATPDSISIINFSYDGLHQLSGNSTSEYSKVTSTWSLTKKQVYIYNNMHNLQSGATYYWEAPDWVAGETFDMTYTAANKLETYIYEARAYHTYTKYIDSFGYIKGINFPVYQRHMEIDKYGPELIEETKTHVNEVSLPDTITCYHNDLEYPEQSTNIIATWTYNSYNNPVTETNVETYTNGADRINLSTIFNYELYDAASVTHDTISPIRAIYPNPTTGSITIAMPALAKGSKVSITISDAAGCTLKQESLLWLHDTVQLPLDRLIAGAYIIVVRDADGKVLGKEKIIKL